jgi:hypothetical protein
MRNITTGRYACNGCYGKRSIYPESQAKKSRSTPTKHLYPTNSGLYLQHEATFCNAHDRNVPPVRKRNNRRVMKLIHNCAIPLTYAFRHECICPVCREIETLNFIVGWITLNVSKESPRRSLYTLRTPPVFLSYWGSRDAASDGEAGSLQKVIQECATRRDLVTLIGPCGKGKGEWAFFPDSDALKTVSPEHIGVHYPVRNLEHLGPEKQLEQGGSEISQTSAPQNDDFNA